MGPGGRGPWRTQSCFPTKENQWGVGFGHRRPPAKQQGPGIQGQPSPASPYGERRAWGENGLHCFPEPRRVGGVVCCPRRVSLCRMQLPEARHGPSLRRGLGAERPSWLRGHGWGLGAEDLRAPNPTSQRRRTSGEWVSGAGDPQQSSSAQGARGSPAQLRPMESGGPGAKTACVDFLRRGKLRLWCAAQGEFPFAECSSQKLVLGRPCDRDLALSGQACSGGMAGAWAQKALACPIMLPHEGEPVGSGIRAPETPSKAAGPREPGAAQRRFALWRAEGGGRKQLVWISFAEAR